MNNQLLSYFLSSIRNAIDKLIAVARETKVDDSTRKMSYLQNLSQLYDFIKDVMHKLVYVKGENVSYKLLLASAAKVYMLMISKVKAIIE